VNFAIGVDGGGTWTRAVVVGQDGQELGRGETEVQLSSLMIQHHQLKLSDVQLIERL